MTRPPFTLPLCRPCLLTWYLRRPQPAPHLHTPRKRNDLRTAVSLTPLHLLNTPVFFHETRNIYQFPASFAAVVPHDWLNNPDSLKNLEESFRIASNLDWANIDLSGYPGQLCESLHAKWILRRLWVYVHTLVSTLPLSDGCACALWGV